MLGSNFVLTLYDEANNPTDVRLVQGRVFCPSGTITVIKEALPQDPQDFRFSGDLGSFLLDDDGDSTLPDRRTFSPLEPGTYSVSEQLLAGWPLHSIVIADPDNQSSVDLANGKATIDLDPGENITVTFSCRI